MGKCKNCETVKLATVLQVNLHTRRICCLLPGNPITIRQWMHQYTGKDQHNQYVYYIYVTLCQESNFTHTPIYAYKGRRHPAGGRESSGGRPQEPHASKLPPIAWLQALSHPFYRNPLPVCNASMTASSFFGGRLMADFCHEMDVSRFPFHLVFTSFVHLTMPLPLGHICCLQLF